MLQDVACIVLTRSLVPLALKDSLGPRFDTSVSDYCPLCIVVNDVCSLNIIRTSCCLVARMHVSSLCWHHLALRFLTAERHYCILSSSVYPICF